MNEEKKEFAVGDLVVVSGACETELYSNGDVGSIEEILYNGEIFIDFSNQNNNFVFDDGRWCCNKEEIKHYTPIEDLPLWKDNYMYLNNEQQQALRKLLHRVQWDDEYAEKIFYAKEATYLVDSFVWDETDEGSNYWSNIEDQCVNEEVPQHIEEEDVLPKKLREVLNNMEERSKPDGGSSDYYKLTITRVSDGETFDCEMGDIIYSVFGGDFDLGNIVKACRRSYLATIGQGKQGTSIAYDMNKIAWFSGDYEQRTKYV